MSEPLDHPPRTPLARVMLAAWCNITPEQIPPDRVWIEHPNDLNRQAWLRVAEAAIRFGADEFQGALEQAMADAYRDGARDFDTRKGEDFAKMRAAYVREAAAPVIEHVIGRILADG